MDKLLTRHFWLINLALCTGGAWLLSGIVDSVIAHELREIPGLTRTAANTPRPSLLPQHEDLGGVVKRNYFGSTLSGTDPGGPGGAQPAPEGSPVGERSELPLSLVGTIVAEANRWSMALVTDDRRSETGLYRLKDTLPGQATLVAILTDKVVLERNGGFEHLLLEEGRGHQMPEDPRRRKTPRGSGPTTDVDKRIRCSMNHCAIERSLVTDSLTDMRTLVRGVRIVPTGSGFRLFAIRPGSLYAKLGLQNGDVINKINGYRMTSPEIAREAFQKLKTARSIEVELTRRGRKTTMTYSIE